MNIEDVKRLTVEEFMKIDESELIETVNETGKKVLEGHNKLMEALNDIADTPKLKDGLLLLSIKTMHPAQSQALLFYFLKREAKSTK